MRWVLILATPRDSHKMAIWNLALCQADGKEPDAEHETRERDTSNPTELAHKRIPNWQGYGYVKEAKKFVAAFDALQE
jgi:hypothetical protein